MNSPDRPPISTSHSTRIGCEKTNQYSQRRRAPEISIGMSPQRVRSSCERSAIGMRMCSAPRSLSLAHSLWLLSYELCLCSVFPFRGARRSSPRFPETFHVPSGSPVTFPKLILVPFRFRTCPWAFLLVHHCDLSG